MQLTSHFSYKDVVATSSKLDNTPDEALFPVLKLTAMNMEMIRIILGNHPIFVNSWFRSVAVNNEKHGSKTSAHLTGYAVDFRCPGFGSPAQVVQKLRDMIQFDQLIYEHPAGRSEWIHVSFDPRFRGQVLETYDAKTYLPY